MKLAQHLYKEGRALCGCFTRPTLLNQSAHVPSNFIWPDLNWY